VGANTASLINSGVGWCKRHGEKQKEQIFKE